MTKSRSKPNIQVFKRDGQLLPVTQYDGQMLEDLPDGQLFNISPASKRSDPHHKLYWAVLGNVVKATGKWATAGHLHDDLKMMAGYYRTVANGVTGGLYYVPDSTAYQRMDQAEFAAYFDAAMKRLSEAVGFDPLNAHEPS
jgi:hypothetical protein